MPQVKHQHFVPQLYLKRFTENGKRLHVFDKFRQISFPANVHTVGSKSRFYDWTQEHVESVLAELENQKIGASRAKLDGLNDAIETVRKHQTQFVEGHLADIENRFSKIYRDIVAELDQTKNLKLTPQLKIEL